MDIKKELKIGLLLAFFTLVITIFFVVQNEQKNTNNNKKQVGPVENTVKGPFSITTGEVSRHSTSEDCWIIISNKVYDVSGFSAKHPGGNGAIEFNCGKDGTQAFLTKGGKGAHSQKAMDLLETFVKGDLSE